MRYNDAPKHSIANKAYFKPAVKALDFRNTFNVPLQVRIDVEQYYIYLEFTKEDTTMYIPFKYKGREIVLKGNTRESILNDIHNCIFNIKQASNMKIKFLPGLDYSFITNK